MPLDVYHAEDKWQRVIKTKYYYLTVQVKAVMVCNQTDALEW